MTTTVGLDTALPSFQHYVDIPTRREKYIGFMLRKHHGSTTLSVYICSTNSNANITSHLSTVPHSGRRTPLHNFRAPWHALIGTFLKETDKKASIITDYINFCIETTIPVKNIIKYPNSKPWITPQIRNSLKQKHKAFRQKDWTALKLVNRTLKNEFLKAKHKY